MTDTVGRGVLEIDGDATGISAAMQEAKRSISDLEKQAATAGKNAGAALDAAGDGATRSARKVDASTKSIISSIQRQIAVSEAGTQGTSKYFESIAKQRGVSIDALRPYLDQLDKAKAGNIQLGNTAKQTANALRMVPAQFTDIAVSLGSGQSPFTVLLQQGGQLKDMFGGVGPAARALGGYVAGLVNPFTLTAAAVAALAIAYKQGSDEQEDFAKAIYSTGNFAGTSTRQLAGMAAAIDDNVGTANLASEVLGKLVGTGAIYGDQLQDLAQSAIEWERATGKAVDETVAEFAQLAKDPVAASERLNEKYHYLTLSVYEQIKALQKQGDTQAAAELAERSYSEAMSVRAKQIEENLNWIGRGWKSVKDFAKETWDEMLGIDREDSLEERLKEAKESLDEIQKSSRNFDFWGNKKSDQVATAQRAVDILQGQVDAQNAAAKAQADIARKQAEGIEAEKKVSAIRESTLTNVEKKERELAEYRLNIEKIRAANPNSPLLDPASIKKGEDNIEEKYKDKNAFSLSKELNKELSELDNKVRQSSENFGGAADDLKKYFDGTAASIAEARSGVEDISDFLMTDEERLKESYERRLGMLDTAHEYELMSDEKHSKLRLKLQEKYDKDARALQAANTAYILGNASQVFDGLAGIAEASAGKQSAFYKTMFIASKAFSIAQAIINTEEAATKALTMGPVLGIPASNLIRGLGYTSVAMIAGQALAGIAHSGMDNIPREGTWLLNGGERVIAPEQNKDLTAYLAQRETGGGGTNVTIIEDASRAGRVEQRDDETVVYVSRFKEAVAADIVAGGNSISRAIEQTYGFGRAAGARR